MCADKKCVETIHTNQSDIKNWGFLLEYPSGKTIRVDLKKSIDKFILMSGDGVINEMEDLHCHDFLEKSCPTHNGCVVKYNECKGFPYTPIRESMKCSGIKMEEINIPYIFGREFENIVALKLPQVFNLKGFNYNEDISIGVSRKQKKIKKTLT